MVGTKKKLPLELSIYIRYLYQDKNVPIQTIVNSCRQYSQATIYRHVKKPIITELVDNNRASNLGGRPKKINSRDSRKLVRSLHALNRLDGSFTSKRVQLTSGITHVSNRTIRRHLNQRGYHYLQSRKKGLLSELDLKKRVKFARDMLTNYDSSVWKTEIAFYLDGTSFVHKTNPADQAKAPGSREWRKYKEGLKRGCTAKGSKVGHGGKSADFVVAISYKKGVICCEEYEKMNGKYFASFVRNNFADIFNRSINPNSKLYQDLDPSQNSKWREMK